MEYPALFVSDEDAGGYVVTFPDVPEAITQGETVAEAEEMASDALALALTFYIDRWADLPTASKPRPGMRMIPVSALSEAKLRLYSATRSLGLARLDFAKILNCTPSQADALLDVTQQSGFQAIESAFAALGKRMVIVVRDAA